MNDKFLERFSALSRVYGEAGLEQLAQTHICVVGIGGVGSWVAESLARSAVGSITLIDGDTVARSNINRQVIALESSVGRAKVEVMRERILDINPECHCNPIQAELSASNMRELLEQDYNCVIDAIDGVKVKSQMAYHCRRNKIKLVMTGGAGGLLDPTQVRICDLSKTYNDPLAAKVRSELRRNYNFSRNKKRSFGIPCVYSTEQQRYPTTADSGEVSYRKPGVAGLSLDCAFGYGSSVSVTAAMAQAATFKVIQLSLQSINKQLKG
ncbi:MAG: tRNA threonylcarbamoyladenosine dehydratase [Thiotrichales bacterium]|jgi:tRNA A37 threonylcarbamoyladenosine dehydratase|nr:tRNA threonylcarbamoyladenosine dehydratase [Thiotrichales bacterium]MBT3753389.1 tRNA threonylcarbamoyladenosine dehydratase [Thiotrichales bacterium]MBT3837500.1 tRNA threonylcarbamoyladenosine dehydratase [Thiotrichales bacterium]MBT4152372.1 tRNA threonylcarbamoyladenosine dehydratase [Thiotrichales bacterium]MBT4261122.1 tRNA threonylcarbamoyladenosine dehydratase [Thiotrichales bacterium]